MMFFNRVRHRSQCGNVFHLCVHKTGSQWVRRILADDRTYRYSGLTHHQYQKQLPGGTDRRKITKRSFDQPFPPGTIVSPVYIDYANYAAIPKPESARAFFVMRDPRDIVVSWFYSMKYSHASMGKVEEVRETLKEVEVTEGIEFAIGALQDLGLFDALRSWANVPEDDHSVMVVRYEDLIGSGQVAKYRAIFSHCDIAMPDRVLEKLLSDYSFKALSGGRDQGREDTSSHFRKGVAGDWREAFSEAAIERFKAETGDLATELGYGW